MLPKSSERLSPAAPSIVVADINPVIDAPVEVVANFTAFA